MPSLCGLLNQFTRDSPEVPPRAHACEKAPHGSIFGLCRIGILRIPAAARIFHQGFLSPGLEYLTEIPAAICLLVCGLVMARIEKRGLGDYGLSLRRGASKHFLWGLFWGLCVFSGVIALIAALHGFSFGGLALHGLALLKYASL
jgi:hypothetical protein